MPNIQFEGDQSLIIFFLKDNFLSSLQFFVFFYFFTLCKCFYKGFFFFYVFIHIQIAK